MTNSTSHDDPHANLRRMVYALLIVTSAATMVGRIFAVKADHGRTPFLSANDRSRWCTIRALVDHGTYAIDDVTLIPGTQQFDPDWRTIDMVRHKGHDGKEHYYSSKPTLLPTLLAAQYGLIKHVIGASISENPFYVGRFILILTNVLPLLLYFYLVAQLVERYGQTDWGRLFVMTCATWATFLTTFSVTLNNHLPAAISVLIAICVTLAIWNDERRAWPYFAIAGLFSAFAAANELPALSFFVLMSAAFCWKSPRQTIVAFTPAAAIVFFGFFYTNQLAHDSLRPPYAHRSDRQQLAILSADAEQDLKRGVVPDQLREKLSRLGDSGINISRSAQVFDAPIIQPQMDKANVVRRWMLWDPDGQDRLAIVRLQLQENPLRVCAWGNWYEYEHSYWLDGNKQGIDLGEKSRIVYVFHLLLGHHGIFSLTPIWLLAVVGMAMLLVGPDNPSDKVDQLLEPVSRSLKSIGIGKLLQNRQYNLRSLAFAILLLSLVCLMFYMARPLKDRNYGGVTCGLRWMFWFTPMWLICLLPAADALASSKTWRRVGHCMLAISVLSATYGALNPWVHPWIYVYMDYLRGPN